MTLQEFSQMWSHHKGILYVADIESYDEIDDLLEEGITKPIEIFNKVSQPPYFALWMTDVQYAPQGFLRKEYYLVEVTDFFIVDDGIIAMISWEQVRQLKEQKNES